MEEKEEEWGKDVREVHVEIYWGSFFYVDWKYRESSHLGVWVLEIRIGVITWWIVNYTVECTESLEVLCS